MRRRDFIVLMGGAAVVRPLTARAQQPTTPVVGFLHTGEAAAFVHLLAAFKQGLKEVGYIESQNVAIESRWAEGHYDRLPALAAELVRWPVSVLVAGGGEASASAAKAATTTIPIVFSVGGDPVKDGFVSSLARPGGNMTGVNILAAEVEAKRLGLLHELIPDAALIAYLVNPDYPLSAANIVEVKNAVRQIGRQILVLEARTENEIERAFSAMVQARVSALLVGAEPYFNSRRNQIVALAAQRSIPAIYEQREFAVAGGLMSYGTKITEAYRQLGAYAGAILKGAKPADLPVIQLTRFEFVINLKTAKKLGLAVSPDVLSIADEVIE